jgi:xenotropic and polytropic retrovirus receptor 1
VNHVLIFELDPRHHLSEQHLMELAAIFGVIWALSLLGLLYSERLSIPAYYSPVALAVVMTIFLINPVLLNHFYGFLMMVL